MSFVQSITATASPVTSVTTASATTTAGNCFCTGLSGDSGGTGSASDNKSNTFTALTGNPRTPSGTDTGWGFTCPGPNGGAGHTFAGTTTAGSSALAIIVHEFSGRATSSVIDQQNAVTEVSSVTSHSTGSITTGAAAGDDLWAFAVDDKASGTETFTAGSGFAKPSNSEQTNANLFVACFAQHQDNVAASTAFSNTWTSAAAVLGGGFLVALKAAAGGAPPDDDGDWINFVQAA